MEGLCMNCISRALLRAALLLTVATVPALGAENPLKCVQKPLFWIVGQQARLEIETPPDCGELQVSLPPEVEMFDRRPWKAGDACQYFYLRAKGALPKGAILFKAGVPERTYT